MPPITILVQSKIWGASTGAVNRVKFNHTSQISLVRKVVASIEAQQGSLRKISPYLADVIGSNAGRTRILPREPVAPRRIMERCRDAWVKCRHVVAWIDGAQPGGQPQELSGPKWNRQVRGGLIRRAGR